MGIGLTICSRGSGKSPAHEPTDDNSIDPLEIICNSYELLRDHAVTSTCILLTIVLPAAVALLSNQCFFVAIAHKFLPYPRPPPEETRPDIRLLIFIGVLLLVSGFALTVNLVAAVFFFVSVVCAGKSVTFKDVVRALPSQWKGVAVTGLWGQLLFFGMALGLILLQILIMMFFDVSRIPLAVLIIITFVVTRGFLFLVVTTLQMAFAVTVFEEVHGFKNFVRGWKLLRHQWCVAFVIFAIVEVPRTLLGDALSLILKYEQTLSTKVVFIVMVVALASLLTSWGSVSYALFYKSCYSNQVGENLLSKDKAQIGIQYQGF